MTKEEFKRRWESNKVADYITYEDIIDCAIEWGISPSPKNEYLDILLYLILCIAQVKDAKKYKPVSEGV